jgi:hypothetical protein
MAVGLPALVAFAAVLGWLKSLYYYRAFGLGLGLLDLSFADHLLESWFVVQNLLFFVLMWWIVIRTRRLWVAIVAILHGVLPIASHYAFAFHDHPLGQALIHYRHTLLKLLPFGVLGIVWLAYPRFRQPLARLSWPYGGAALALFGIVIVSWGVSAAKHFGSYDANLALLSPSAQLARVEIRQRVRNETTDVSTDVTTDLPTDGRLLYLVHADRNRLIVWDPSGFEYGRTPEVRTIVVRSDGVEWLEVRAGFQIQPGRMFL